MSQCHVCPRRFKFFLIRPIIGQIGTDSKAFLSVILSDSQGKTGINRRPLAAKGLFTHSTNNKIRFAFERAVQKKKYNTFLEKSCNGKIYDKPTLEEQKMIQSRLSVPYKLGQIARPIPGHHEGDPINGTQDRSTIGTLEGRTFLFTVLSRKDKASVETALNGVNHMLNRFEV